MLDLRTSSFFSSSSFLNPPLLKLGNLVFGDFLPLRILNLIIL